MKIVISLALVSSCVALGACGPGGGGHGTTSYAAAEVSPSAANYFDQDTTNLYAQGVVVSNAADNRVTNDNPPYITSRYVNMPSSSSWADGTYRTARANTGKTFAFVYGNESSGVFGRRVGRSEETEVPTSGSATYEGGYTGMIKVGRFAQGSITGSVSGDAEIEVDFDNGEMSGRVINRSYTNNFGNQPMDQIDLATAAIDEQGFVNGTTSGGKISSASYKNDPDKTYVAVIGGTDGDQVLGALRINFRTTSETYEFTEQGVFSTRKQ